MFNRTACTLLSGIFKCSEDFFVFCFLYFLLQSIKPATFSMQAMGPRLKIWTWTSGNVRLNSFKNCSNPGVIFIVTSPKYFFKREREGLEMRNADGNDRGRRK